MFKDVFRSDFEIIDNEGNSIYGMIVEEILRVYLWVEEGDKMVFYGDNSTLEQTIKTKLPESWDSNELIEFIRRRVRVSTNIEELFD